MEKKNFQTVDVLSSSPSSDFSHKFDLALDKGTYDAISLSEDKGIFFLLTFL